MSWSSETPKSEGFYWARWPQAPVDRKRGPGLVCKHGHRWFRHRGGQLEQFDPELVVTEFTDQIQPPKDGGAA